MMSTTKSQFNMMSIMMSLFQFQCTMTSITIEQLQQEPMVIMVSFQRELTYPLPIPMAMVTNTTLKVTPMPMNTKVKVVVVIATVTVTVMKSTTFLMDIISITEASHIMQATDIQSLLNIFRNQMMIMIMETTIMLQSLSMMILTFTQCSSTNHNSMNSTTIAIQKSLVLTLSLVCMMKEKQTIRMDSSSENETLTTP